MSSELHLETLSLLLKLTFVFTLILGITFTLRRLEPRWRVLFCRVAFVGVPAVVLGSLISPLMSLPLFPNEETNRTHDASLVSSALFPASSPLLAGGVSSQGPPREIQHSEEVELPRKISPASKFPWSTGLVAIWLSGVAICLFLDLLQWKRLRKLVQDALPANEKLQSWWNETSHSFDFPSEKVSLWVVE